MLFIRSQQQFSISLFLHFFVDAVVYWSCRELHKKSVSKDDTTTATADDDGKLMESFNRTLTETIKEKK